ncbi:MAG: hypothetical protein GY935_19510, partial [Gammaproteobacteria bacterium]|nr:hypothetical protein [Gammaproteobacteria bacterium]
MANFTTDHRVLTYQWELAQIMVKAHVLLPRNFLMALVAFGSLIAVMDIILLVAAETGRIDFLAFCANDMTGVADQILMRTVECEIRVCAMVKLRISPAPDDVAVLTFFAVQLIVCIVGAVAAIAITWLGITFFGYFVIDSMAVVATHPAVPFFEFVLGVPAMLKKRFIPAPLLVTGFAIITKPVAVNVSYRMTIHAILWCILVFLIDVTGITSYS